MTFAQTIHTTVEESFEKGSVHFLKKAIIKDTGLEFCDRLSFEEVQVHAGNQIRTFSCIDLKAGLRKQNGLGTQRLACPCLPFPGDAMLPHCGQHFDQNIEQKPGRERPQGKRPVF